MGGKCGGVSWDRVRIGERVHCIEPECARLCVCSQAFVCVMFACPCACVCVCVMGVGDGGGGWSLLLYDFTRRQHS